MTEFELHLLKCLIILLKQGKVDINTAYYILTLEKTIDKELGL